MISGSLTEEEWAILNMDLLLQFSNFALEGIQYLHIFLPILSRKEVDTFLLAVWIREHYPTIQLVTSQSNFETNDMRHVIWYDDAVLQENAYGIPEPVGGDDVNPLLIDAVLIPMLAFDENGHRVGYGKGMYDRFLSLCKPKVLKIGLSLFDSLPAPITDIYAGDISLDVAITPGSTYYFNSKS